jgi:UDP-glucuronate 4-epimerase
MPDRTAAACHVPGQALITGAAGFIGSHVTETLLARGARVVGLDNFDPHYPAGFKRQNLAAALTHSRFTLVEADCRDRAALDRLFAEFGPFDTIAHLAARPGVRPSLAQAGRYFDINVRGTQVLLEAVAATGLRPRFVLASSSSVYGAAAGPFREDQALGKPLSPYAASKHAAELVAYVAHHLHGIPVTVLRFFTAYGPRQRPDMAIPQFAARLLRGAPVHLFGGGDSHRDYTYIGDIVEGVICALERAGGYRTYNLGSGRLTRLDELVRGLAAALDVPLRAEPAPAQPGDVPLTWADISLARMDLGWEPRTSLAEGLAHAAAWWRGPGAATSLAAQ